MLLLFVLVIAVMANRIKPEEMRVLTLSKNKMTTGGRSSPIPQLTCRGRLCAEFTPSTVQCTNMGTDGRDVQWKCEADMPDGYRFGSVDVSCEGYSYPNDPYILGGSCGLTYELEGPGQPYQAYSSPYNDNTASSHGATSRSGFGSLLMWAFLAVLVYAVYRTWKNSHRGGGFGGGGGGFRPDPFNPGAPPPYSDQTGPNCSPPTAGSANQGPGFWSGLFGGGALGYMMGNRNQRPAYGGGYRPSGGSVGSRHTPGSSGGGGGGVRTAYSGTSRR